jgi:hypothetical protein
VSSKSNHISLRQILSAAFALVLALPLVMFGQSASRMEEVSTRLETRAQQTTTATLGSAIQLRVECGNPQAKVKTIAAGLKLLGNLHPAVLLFSGTCHEDVVMQGLDSITLQGNPTATIDGGSDLNVGTVEILGSQNIALDRLTIMGVALGLRIQAITVADLNGDGMPDLVTIGGAVVSVLLNHGRSGQLSASSSNTSPEVGSPPFKRAPAQESIPQE